MSYDECFFYILVDDLLVWLLFDGLEQEYDSCYVDVC